MVLNKVTLWPTMFLGQTNHLTHSWSFISHLLPSGRVLPSLALHTLLFRVLPPTETSLGIQDQLSHREKNGYKPEQVTRRPWIKKRGGMGPRVGRAQTLGLGGRGRQEVLDPGRRGSKPRTKDQYVCGTEKENNPASISLPNILTMTSGSHFLGRQNVRIFLWNFCLSLNSTCYSLLRFMLRRVKETEKLV